MEKVGSWSSTEFHVKSSDPVMVLPCIPLPKTVLHLSPIDTLATTVIFNSLLVYNATPSPSMISADPAKTIREALSKVLVYYPVFAGRLRSKENGGIEVECTGEGALFVEAMADNDLSVLGDMDNYNPSCEELLFWHPPDTRIQDFHLLTLQVTRFTCGGFVVGVNFHHSVCDGRGAGQFLKGLAEMARGEVKPSVEPIWKRELINLEDLARLQYHHLALSSENACNPLPPPIVEESISASMCVSSEIINCMKQCVIEECKEIFTSFEIVAAMAWRARTKALQIPHTENVKFIFAMDTRRSFNPPLPKGYYGNALGIACAFDNAHDLLNGSLSRVAMIIKKSKVSLNEEILRSRVVMNQSIVFVKQENVFSLSDWSQLGFNEVDFGWGDAVNVCPVQKIENGSTTPNYFLFIRPPKSKCTGIKLVMHMPPSTLKSFQIEMEAMIKTYVTNI